MRMQIFLATAVCALCGIAAVSSDKLPARQPLNRAQAESHVYLGFDRNTYPGDAALVTLRKTFSFTGYWLNNPPGETSNSWRGKREILNSNGFGFLLLF